MSELKYKLTEEFIEVGNRRLYRIEALISFRDVEAGEKGGFIEKDSNLEQSGNAWVYGNAQVYGDAWEKSPLQIQGTRWFINMATKTILKIGCQEHKLSFWLKYYKKIAENNNADEATTNEYYLYIKLAAELYLEKEESKEVSE